MSFVIVSTKTGSALKIGRSPTLAFRKQSCAVRVAHAIELASECSAPMSEFVCVDEDGLVRVNDWFGRVAGPEAWFGSSVHVRWVSSPPYVVFEETDVPGVYEPTFPVSNTDRWDVI
jgi:hypothetical protein